MALLIEQRELPVGVIHLENRDRLHVEVRAIGLGFDVEQWDLERLQVENWEARLKPEVEEGEGERGDEEEENEEAAAYTNNTTTTPTPPMWLETKREDGHVCRRSHAWLKRVTRVPVSRRFVEQHRMSGHFGTSNSLLWFSEC